MPAWSRVRLPSDELASRVGLKTRQSVHDRLKKRGRIVGWQGARRGYVFPAGQLDERGRPLEGLDRLAGLLHDGYAELGMPDDAVGFARQGGAADASGLGRDRARDEHCGGGPGGRFRATGGYDPDVLRSGLHKVRFARVFRVVHRDHRSTPLAASRVPRRFSDPPQRG